MSPAGSHNWCIEPKAAPRNTNIDLARSEIEQMRGDG